MTDDELLNEVRENHRAEVAADRLLEEREDRLTDQLFAPILQDVYSAGIIRGAPAADFARLAAKLQKRFKETVTAAWLRQVL